MSTFPETFNLADYFLFDRIREGHGANPALRFGAREYDYDDVAERATALARWFVEPAWTRPPAPDAAPGVQIERQWQGGAGLAPGERVYIALPDTPAFAWSIFGVLAAGGVLAMGNPHAPVEDLAYTIRYIKAAVVITTPAVAEALATLQALPGARDLPYRHLLESPDAPTGDDVEASGSLCDAIARGRQLTTTLPEIHRDDPAVWLFTSGSTGKSKAAMHSQRDFAFNTEVYAKGTVGYRAGDVTVSVPRLFFGYATGTNLWFPFAVGATVGLFSERPTAESVAAAIARYRPTIVTNVPTMLGKLLDLDDERRRRGEPGLDLSCVRFHLSAGEALPEPLMRRFTERFGAEVYDGIGSAEMFHIYCSNRPGDIMPGSLGRVVDGYELRVLPEDATGAGAEPVPVGEIGVLWVRGDSVAHGYFQDRDKSWKTFHGHWCRTGDLFRIDERGYLWFSGRSDDLFKVGGIFVAPREVEECLMEHAAVSAVAVIAGDDGGLTKPKAVVELRPDARVSSEEQKRALEAELKAHVQSRLSKHKYPRWVIFVDELPKNDRGKVDKKRLAELL